MNRPVGRFFINDLEGFMGRYQYLDALLALPRLVYPNEDEGHGIYRPNNMKALLLRLGEFFEGAFSE